MDFALSVEQQDLADAERAWLQRNDPILERREGIDDGPARIGASLRKHAVDAGLTSLMTTDIGATHVDLLVLAEAHGWAGSALPVAEAALGARLLEIAGHPAWEAAAAGEEIALPVTARASASFEVELRGDTVHLRGTSASTAGLLDADRIVVAGALDDREVIAVLPTEDLDIRALDTLDLLRSWAVADIDLEVPAGDWAYVPAGTAALLADQLAVFHTVDALGAADRLLGLAVDYAGQRTQFGSSIGSFQAVKHHLANMALAVEASRSVLWAAAAALDDWAADEAAPEVRTRTVAAAVVYARRAASEVAQLALQVHGGIGFTWEHDLHLLLRRIRIDELADGGAAAFGDRLIDVYAVSGS